MTQLLFHILESCEDYPALGKVVEEFVWSSWNLHDDEQVGDAACRSPSLFKARPEEYQWPVTRGLKRETPDLDRKSPLV